MITEEFAKTFTQAWIDAWNSHDLEQILSHYSDDFVIETPMAARLIPESKGLIEGKPAVRTYWQLGISRIPDLHFQLIDLLVGVQSLTIYYLNTATGKRSVENMFFTVEGKVSRAFVNYSL
ncbi:nuclear transport factor 2 family protein [Spirosoma koreense]